MERPRKQVCIGQFMCDSQPFTGSLGQGTEELVMNHLSLRSQMLLKSLPHRPRFTV